MLNMLRRLFCSLLYKKFHLTQFSPRDPAETFSADGIAKLQCNTVNCYSTFFKKESVNDSEQKSNAMGLNLTDT